MDLHNNPVTPIRYKGNAELVKKKRTRGIQIKSKTWVHEHYCPSTLRDCNWFQKNYSQYKSKQPHGHKFDKNHIKEYHILVKRFSFVDNQTD